MLSRYLIIPFGLGVIACIILAINCNQGHEPYLIMGALGCVLCIIAIYFFSDVIDWKWYQKNPPTIDDELRNRLEERHPFYQSLSAEHKTKFEQRLELYIRANEFIPNGWEHVPYDIQAWVAVHPIMITFFKEDYLLSQFERIVIYPHSFPSPQFPERFHCSEVYEEDGVILFSTEKLLPGAMQPKLYFNIGIYEYAKVYQLSYPNFDYPQMDDSDRLTWELIVKYTRIQLEEYIGLTDLDDWGILVALFFSHPVEMEEKLSHHYDRVKKILEWERI